MARPKRFPPSILTHARGFDFIRVYEDGRPRDIRLGPTGSPEAKAKYARLVAEMTANGGTLPDRPAPASGPNGCTIPDVCERWRVHVATAYDHARSPEPGNYRWICRVLLRLFPDLPAAEFTADHLEQFRTAILTGSWMTPEERGKFLGRWKVRARPLGLCRGQANRRVIGLRTMWRWCERKRLVPPGSWAALRALPPLRSGAQGARPSKPRVVATAEMVERVAVELSRRTVPVDVMLRVQWLTGARSAEVRIMRPVDIDRSADVWRYRPARHKNDWRTDASGQPQERVIPLGPECQRLLAPLLDITVPEEYLFCPRYGSRAACYSKGAYCLAVKRAAERAGLVGFHPYACRSGAKARVTKAHGLEAARVFLGHRSLFMTHQYDTALDQDTADRVARDMG